MPQDLLLEDALKKFKLEHYLDMDIDYWFNKLNMLQNKFELLKDPKKQNRIVFELYFMYLQMLEVLFINAHAVSVNNDSFPSALFISSKNIRSFIDDNFISTTKFSTWFLNNYIFAIQTNLPDYKDRYKQYSNLLCSISKDYLDNYQLLNSYKHGCRVSAKHGKNSISIVNNKNERQLLIEGDCQIVYFSREPIIGANDPKLENTQAVFKRSVTFKIQKLFGDCAFVIALLQNTRLTTLIRLGETPKDKVMQVSLLPEEWKKSLGGFSFKEPLFSFKKVGDIKDE